MKASFRKVVVGLIALVVAYGCVAGCSRLTYWKVLGDPTLEATSIVTTSLTSTPPYSLSSSNNLTFSYPSDWKTNTRMEMGSEDIFIQQIDHGNENFPPTIHIIYYQDLHSDVDNRAASFISTTMNMGGEILGDQMITIDDIPARYITRTTPEILDAGIPPSYNEFVFVSLKNDTLSILLTTIVEKSDSEFVDEFHKMLGTIKIMKK